MCHYYRTLLDCNHYIERIAPHKGGDHRACDDQLSSNVTVTKGSGKCSRCIKQQRGATTAPSSASGRATGADVDAIAAKLSGIQVSVPAGAPPATKRPSTPFAAQVRRMATARVTTERSTPAAGRPTHAVPPTAAVNTKTPAGKVAQAVTPAVKVATEKAIRAAAPAVNAAVGKVQARVPVRGAAGAR